MQKLKLKPIENSKIYKRRTVSKENLLLQQHNFNNVVNVNIESKKLILEHERIESNVDNNLFNNQPRPERDYKYADKALNNLCDIRLLSIEKNFNKLDIKIKKKMEVNSQESTSTIVFG